MKSGPILLDSGFYLEGYHLNNLTDTHAQYMLRRLLEQRLFATVAVTPVTAKMSGIKSLPGAKDPEPQFAMFNFVETLGGKNPKIGHTERLRVPIDEVNEESLRRWVNEQLNHIQAEV